MAAIRARGAAALAWLERLASRRLGALVLFLGALAVYAIQAVAWPLKTGRDLDEYLYAYIQLFDGDVLLPWSLLFRTPLTPVVSGVSLASSWNMSAYPGYRRSAALVARATRGPNALAALAQARIEPA